MTAARILLVEDEPSLARGLVDNLRDAGHEVRHVERGDVVEAAVLADRPDLVVLDLMLPGKDGLDVLSALRGRGLAVPVLVLTAKGDVTDRVVGLELGADDYLAKPFAVRELLARVKALLRRASARERARAIEVGGVRFDFGAMAASGAPGADALTTHDIRVLEVLAQRRGEVVSRADIVEEVCGLDSSATLRTVDNHVVALRRVVERDPRRPRHIVTVRGIGYRLADED